MYDSSRTEQPLQRNSVASNSDHPTSHSEAPQALNEMRVGSLENGRNAVSSNPDQPLCLNEMISVAPESAGDANLYGVPHFGSAGGTSYGVPYSNIQQTADLSSSSSGERSGPIVPIKRTGGMVALLCKQFL